MKPPQVEHIEYFDIAYSSPHEVLDENNIEGKHKNK